MSAITTQGAASAAPAFDAREWLDRYQQAGGGFVLTPAGKLWFLTEAVDGLSLTIAMAQIVGRPDRLASVRDTIAAVRS